MFLQDGFEVVHLHVDMRMNTISADDEFSRQDEILVDGRVLYLLVFPFVLLRCCQIVAIAHLLFCAQIDEL